MNKAPHRTEPRKASIFRAPDRLDTDLAILHELGVIADGVYAEAERLSVEQAVTQTRVVERQEGLNRAERARIADILDQLIHYAKAGRNRLETSARAERKEAQEKAGLK